MTTNHAPPAPGALWVDGHVHLHPLFDLEKALGASGRQRPAGAGAVLWLLTESAGGTFFAQLTAGDLPLPAGWSLRSVEARLLALESADAVVWILAGRQIRARHGLEVHGWGLREPLREGQPVPETCRQVREAGGIAVLPYGFGKWRGNRHGELRAALEALGDDPPWLADSGIRPGHRPLAALYPELRAGARGILAGTDPLPLLGEEERIASFGFLLPGDDPGEERPLSADALLDRLQALPAEPPLLGKRVTWARALRQQFLLRAGVAQPLPGPEAPRDERGRPVSARPDLESSGQDYAGRFAGETGAFLLERQEEACRQLLAGRTPPGRVLDLGGGHGQLAPALVRAGWEVTIAESEDAPREVLAEAMQDLPYERVTVDFLHLPYPADAFDLVLGFRLVTHEPDWPELLREMIRVSRGPVLFDYPDLRSANVLYAALFALKKRFEKNTRSYTVLTRRQVRTALRLAGARPADAVGQFFFPMVVHRALRRAAWSRTLERAAARMGLSAAFGSPRVVRAEKGEARG
jgi:SAM-dependent methyltransferase